MPVRTGTAGNDDYQGVAGLSDTADIEAILVGSTFSYTDSYWTVTSGAGQDRLFSIEEARFSDALIGLSLGGETRVDTTGGARNAQVTTLSNGNYVVTFEVTDGSGTGIFSQIYSAAGERIGAETRVNASTANTQSTAAISALSEGGYAIAWVSALQDGSGNGVYMQRYDAAGAAVGGETLVNTYTASDQGAPAIISLTNGRFVVAWQSLGQDGSGNGVYMQRFSDAGTLLGGETLVNTAFSNGQEAPAVAMIAGGSYVVTWQSLAQDGSGYGVFAQRFSVNGVPQGTEFQVNTTTALDQSAPAIASLASGGYVVTWQSNTQDGSGWGVFAQVFTAAGAKVGGEVQINSFATNGQEAPVVTSLADGGFVVLWQSAAQDGSGYGVYAQRFDASGARVGDEIRVNSYTFSDQMDPAVAALSDGGFVVTWEGTGASGSGVYSQRFGADGLPILPKLSGDLSPNVIVATGTTAVAIDGGDGDDRLTSGAGDDILDGGLGRDTLRGGQGNDIYKADAEDRIIEAENGGVDTALVTANFTITSAYLENVTLTGAAAASLVGNGLDNVLTGNAADNSLNGLQGADRLIGGRGNDIYFVNAVGDDVVEETDGGVDTVVSQIDYQLGDHEEILRLVGSAAQGTGNALDNQIIGNAASNRLDGGTGADLLVGDEGDDLYIVDADDQVVEESDDGTDTVHAAASWTLGDNVENVTLLGTGQFNATGNDLANILYGNSGNNVLDGRGGADFMDGGNGDDVYHVDHASDSASETAASTRDVVRASVTHALGNGIEELNLVGTAHIGGTGNSLDNIIRGNSGSNALDGAWGRDILYGGYGNDRLTSTDGRDRLIGGVGNDNYEVTGETDEIVELGDQGSDTVRAAVTRSYTLGLNLENLVLLGGNVDGYGNIGLNRITGTTGNNLLDGGEGADRLSGLAGDDTYVVDNRFDVVVEAFNSGLDRVLSSVNYTLAAHIEDLVLTGAGVLAGTGNTLGNRVTGNSAANTLNGLGGGDLLVGAGGNDSLLGGDGNDRLNGGAGRDRLDGGAGTDLATYFGVLSGVTVDLAITVAQDTVAAGIDTLVGIERLSGSNIGGDRLAGDGVANTLEGNGGDDVLGGGDGDDRVLGGEGQDFLTGGGGNDRLDGGNGIDMASFAASTVSVDVDLNLGGPQNTGEGFDTIVNVENLEGSGTAHDRLIGDFENNELYGLGGNDILSGGDGDDRLDGGLGRDTVDYSSAWDGVMVNLGGGIATDDGSGFGDALISIENLIGGEFGDLLIGSAAQNSITGGLGRDVLRGGAGDDIFILRTTAESGITVETRDVIQDFATGDRIDLSGIDANQATVANDAFTALLAADQAFTAAGQLRFANGVLLGNTDADAAAEFAIRLIDVPTLSVSDFIL